MLLAPRRPAAMDVTKEDPTATDIPLQRHTRRGLLSLAVGAFAGAVATALGRPGTAQAAAGDSLKIGQQNYGGSSATRLSTTSSGGALWMTQNGTGSGIRADSTGGHGGVFTTADEDRYGISASNTGPQGIGAAVRAFGGQNAGVYASSTGSGSAVTAESEDGEGVGGSSQTSAGVLGQSDSGVGVQAGSQSGYGLRAFSASNYAARFDNEVLMKEFVDIEEIQTPATPSAATVRLFVNQTELGKSQLCAIFPGGNVVILGTSD